MPAVALLKHTVKRTEQRARHALTRLLQSISAAQMAVNVDETLPLRRILLIRPNFRIGNAAISTPLIACFRARFPKARIDFLGTDKTAALLANQPVNVRYELSRRQLLRPWQYLALVRTLRGNRYDLAVQMDSGLTGYLFVRLVRARYTMGRAEGNRRHYHLEVCGEPDHAYDNALNFARALGSSCRDRPILNLSTLEREEARQLLQARLGMPFAHPDKSFVALSLGGRAGKRWPLENWLALIRILEKNARRFLVFVGPEERGLEGRLREAITEHQHGIVLGPRPLRKFCALLSFAQYLITPDSGPMHLAAGLDVPTIALVKNRISLRYVPRGEHDVTLVEPSPDQVYEALTRSCQRSTRQVIPMPCVCGGSSESPDDAE